MMHNNLVLVITLLLLLLGDCYHLLFYNQYYCVFFCNFAKNNNYVASGTSPPPICCLKASQSAEALSSINPKFEFSFASIDNTMRSIFDCTRTDFPIHVKPNSAAPSPSLAA